MTAACSDHSAQARHPRRLRAAGLPLAAALLITVFAAPAEAAPRGDRNGDGIPDRWAQAQGLDWRIDQRARDQDRDGVRNLIEFRLMLRARDADTDDDGLRDGRELRVGTSPRDADSDDDGLDDGEEFELFTDPLDSDSDDDGSNDGREDSDADGVDDDDELETGSDPFESEADDDEVEDTRITWRVQSYADGAITLLREDTGRVQTLPLANGAEIGADPCTDIGVADVSFRPEQLTAGMVVNWLEVNGSTLEIVELGIDLQCSSNEDAGDEDDD